VFYFYTKQARSNSTQARECSTYALFGDNNGIYFGQILPVEPILYSGDFYSDQTGRNRESKSETTIYLQPHRRYSKRAPTDKHHGPGSKRHSTSGWTTATSTATPQRYPTEQLPNVYVLIGNHPLLGTQTLVGVLTALPWTKRFRLGSSSLTAKATMIRKAYCFAAWLTQ